MKTIALIRLLFTCSQRLCSRQLGLSPSPDRLAGRRPTSSSPSDSNGPYGHLPGTDPSAASADSNIRDKLLECVSKMCSHWERNGFWTFKPVWVLLSPLWGRCCIAGKLPWTLFQDLFEAVQVALRRKWIVTTDLIQSNSICLSPYQRCHLSAGILWSYWCGWTAAEIKTPKAEMSCCD